MLGLFTMMTIKWQDGKKQPDPKPAPPQESSSYRPAFHFSTPDKWKNDPQKPVFFDGKYHYYYLYNGNYPDGGGTEWRHASSEDLASWKDEGVAIPKFTNKNGDIWSGSVVEDKKNTAGFGEGAIVSLVTQPSADGGKQEQYLWYSTDRGKTFQSFSDEPVLSNPGTEVFRDPKVIKDDEHQKWVMTMAEGDKIGFYESGNLKDWTYTGEFKTENIGLIECPDLFQMRADDGTVKWVMGASANGKAAGKPNTYAYWTGTYDGKTFTAENQEPQWLDYGFDWYGGVTFEDGKSEDPLTKRFALAWMNNWDYPHNTPTVKEGFNGVDSIVREIGLKKQADQSYSLTSQPVQTLGQLTESADTISRLEVNGSKTLDTKGDTYQMDADMTWDQAKNIGLRLRESDDQKRHIDIGFLPDQGLAYVNRGFTGQPDESKKYVESKAPFDAGKKKVHVKILVDRTSVEVFVDDGKSVLSNQVFPEPSDQGITLFSEGGPAVFEKIEIKHFRSGAQSS
ncbi:glycoside hydrolase family 32 protein [Bacillus sp. FJAT-42376]|uniref:glycoside hydrolase family 32 protein n=1 Tax=Bacillus sp. FJAT-42376 TaxID=2014076 RepID=UPI000F504CFE|nr:glycoside hydrolase family 32 protein [Bacillus sp. FJAT-42376]AZB44720.1 glycoside hydrolase family 32 protein [Bacillus sp. FJAT-42376]